MILWESPAFSPHGKIYALRHFYQKYIPLNN